MKSRRLRWLTIIVPTAAIAVFDYVRHVYFPEPLHVWPGTILFLVVVALGAFLLSTLVFERFERYQERLWRTTRELSTLNAVAAVAGQARDLPHIADLVLKKTLDLLDLDAGAVFLREQEGTSIGRPIGADRVVLVGAKNWPVGAQESNGVEPTGRHAGRLGDSEGPVAEAVRGGETVCVSNLAAEGSALTKTLHLAGFRYLACVPLKLGERVLGVMALACRDNNPPLSRDNGLLAALGHSIGVVLDNAHLFQETKRRERESDALRRIGTEVSSLLDVDRVTDLVVARTQELFHSQLAALALLDDAGQASQWKVFSGSGGGLKQMKLEAGRSLPSHLATLSQPTGFDPGDGWAEASSLLAGEEMLSGIVAPLKTSERTIGVILVADRHGTDLGEEQVKVLASLANQVSVAITNARLYEQAQHVAVLEERDRIAREMHDSLAQVLGYLTLKANTAKDLLASNSLVRAQQELQDMHNVAEEAYVDVREAILGLRDSIAPSLGLTGTLSEYLQKFGRQNKISARMVVGHGMTPRLAPAVEVQLVRVIQEALANVRKHARARNAWVRFEQDEQWAMVTIEDDGCGFDLATVQVRQGQRFGIATMRERVEGVGGSLEIDTTAGRGTKVIVRLPTSSEESAEWNR